MSASDGGGRIGGSCEIAYVREVRGLLRELALAAMAVAALLAAALAAGAAVTILMQAPPVFVYEDRSAS